MKTLTNFFMMFLVAGAVSAQSITTSAYVERTSVSPKSGLRVGYVDSYTIEYGGFYQESRLMEEAFMSLEEKEALPHNYEKVFWGAYISYPVMDRRGFDLKLNIRTGMVNGGNGGHLFVITPSILANLKLSDKIKIGGGVGVRAFRPTLQTGLTLNF